MNNSDPIVVCDTNIWYCIADGSIKEAELINKRLVGTFVTAYEFCASFMNITNYELLQDAIRAFNEKANGLAIEDPIEYIKAICGYEYNSSLWEDVKRNLEYILYFKGIPYKDAARKTLQDNQDMINLANQAVLNLIDERRRLLPDTKAFRRNMKNPEIVAIHLEQSKSFMASIIPSKAIDWQDLELFILTFDEWLKQLLLDKKMKITHRDWNDIFNLIYVKPGWLYWTNDRIKTVRFIRSCGCGHYLYSPVKSVFS